MLLTIGWLFNLKPNKARMDKILNSYMPLTSVDATYFLRKYIYIYIWRAV